MEIRLPKITLQQKWQKKVRQEISATVTRHNHIATAIKFASVCKTGDCRGKQWQEIMLGV